jgi:hypothetical protein
VKYGIIGCAALLIIIPLLFITSFVAGWVAVPFKVFGANNVSNQWAFAYKYSEALDAAALQVCSTEKIESEATTDAERTARRSQRIALEQNYARIAAEYNARLRNAFEAKLVRPPDVPSQAPSLTSTKANVCP